MNLLFYLFGSKEGIMKIVKEDYDTIYVSNDGSTFFYEEDCRNYERLAEIKNTVAEISSQLKRMTDEKSIHLCTINYDAADDVTVEIFNIETEDDLKLLKEYILLKEQIHYGKTCESTVLEIKQSIKKQFTGVTCGHEVIIFSDWRGLDFWLYGDGSINGYCNCIKEDFLNLIKK